MRWRKRIGINLVTAPWLLRRPPPIVSRLFSPFLAQESDPSDSSSQSGSSLGVLSLPLLSWVSTRAIKAKEAYRREAKELAENKAIQKTLTACIDHVTHLDDSLKDVKKHITKAIEAVAGMAGGC